MYRKTTAWWLENIISLVASGFSTGLPVYLLTGELHLAAAATFNFVWPIFTLLHFPNFIGSYGSRDPPLLYFAAAGFLSFTGLVFGFSPFDIQGIVFHLLINFSLPFITDFSLKVRFKKVLEDNYEIGKVRKIELIGKGTYTTAYQVITDHSKFILRLNQDKKPAILFETQLRNIAEPNSQIPNFILTRNRNSSVQFRKQTLTLTTFLDGIRVSWNEINNNRLKNAALRLAEFHKMFKGAIDSFSIDPRRFDSIPVIDLANLDQRDQSAEKKFERFYDSLPSILPVASYFHNHYEFYIAQIRKLKENTAGKIEHLPQTVFHGDFAACNLLFKGDDVNAVIDFGNSNIGPRILDFANPIVQQDGQLDWQRFKEFISVYQSVAEEPLTREELELLPEMFRRQILQQILSLSTVIRNGKIRNWINMKRCLVSNTELLKKLETLPWNELMAEITNLSPTIQNISSARTDKDKAKIGNPSASILGAKWAKVAGMLEWALAVPALALAGKVIIKGMAWVLVKAGLADEELLKDVRDESKLKPMDAFSKLLIIAGSVSMIFWFASAMISGIWWHAYVSIGIWMFFSGIVFSREHPEVQEDGKVLTYFDRLILFVVGALLAGVTVTPAIFVLMGSPIANLEGVTHLLQAAGLGLVLNILLHKTYNDTILAARWYVNKVESGFDARSPRELMPIMAAAALGVSSSHGIVPTQINQELPRLRSKELLRLSFYSSSGQMRTPNTKKRIPSIITPIFKILGSSLNTSAIKNEESATADRFIAHDDISFLRPLVKKLSSMPLIITDTLLNLNAALFYHLMLWISKLPLATIPQLKPEDEDAKKIVELEITRLRFEKAHLLYPLSYFSDRLGISITQIHRFLHRQRSLSKEKYAELIILLAELDKRYDLNSLPDHPTLLAKLKKTVLVYTHAEIAKRSGIESEGTISLILSEAQGFGHETYRKLVPFIREVEQQYHLDSLPYHEIMIALLIKVVKNYSLGIVAKESKVNKSTIAKLVSGEHKGMIQKTYLKLLSFFERVNDHSEIVSLLQNQRQQHPRALDHKFNQYLIQNDLSQYSTLKTSFTPEIKKVLLENPTLRPVFLVSLSEEKKQVGQLEVVDQKVLDQVGKDEHLSKYPDLLNNDFDDMREKILERAGEDLLDEYTGFLAGSLEVANRMALEGHKMIIGVTDRPYNNNMGMDFNVANGRQVYFPLKDGTWLGVKGIGQLIEEDHVPYDPMHHRGVQFGLVIKIEVDQAVKGYLKIKESSGRFAQFLGYRRLYSVPNGHGGFISTSKLKDSDEELIQPVLVFNRVLTPHRLGKLNQLLQSDPELLNFRTRASKIAAAGFTPPNRILSSSEFMNMIFSELGRSEAVKQNHGLFKQTIHIQDFTLFGEESDNEEFFNKEEYLSYLNIDGWGGRESFSLFTEQGIGVQGIENKMVALGRILTRLEPTDLKILFPSPSQTLEVLFQSYFSNLEEPYLKVWAEKLPKSKRDSVHPAGWILDISKRGLALILAFKEIAPQDDFLSNPTQLRDKIIYKIIGWARAEVKERRKTNKIINRLLKRYTKASLPPASIAADPENYKVGPSWYKDHKESENENFRRTIRAAAANLTYSEQKLAESRLDLLLKRPELESLACRQAEEIVYEFTKTITGVKEPMLSLKEAAQKSALDLLPEFERQLSYTLSGRLKGESAVLLAVSGNRASSKQFFEAAMKGTDELKKYARSFPDVDRTMEHATRVLLDELEQKKRSEVLYLMDNVIEDVYDLPFIKWLLEKGHKVTLVGKAVEADNDATVQDIERLLSYPEVRQFLGKKRIKNQIKIISSGSATRGTDLHRATPEFIQAWKTADVIIVKGEGNRGTLSNVTKSYYNLAIAKSLHEMPGKRKGESVVEQVNPSAYHPTASRMEDALNAMMEMITSDLSQLAVVEKNVLLTLVEMFARARIEVLSRLKEDTRSFLLVQPENRPEKKSERIARVAGVIHAIEKHKDKFIKRVLDLFDNSTELKPSLNRLESEEISPLNFLTTKSDLLSHWIPPYLQDDNNLLSLPFVGHALAMKEVLNPKDLEKMTALYGGAGADISTFLLATNATKSYFVNKAETKSRLLSHIIDDWWEELDSSYVYSTYKRFAGFASIASFRNLISGKESLEIPIAT